MRIFLSFSPINSSFPLRGRRHGACDERVYISLSSPLSLLPLPSSHAEVDQSKTLQKLNGKDKLPGSTNPKLDAIRRGERRVYWVLFTPHEWLNGAACPGPTPAAAAVAAAAAAAAVAAKCLQRLPHLVPTQRIVDREDANTHSGCLRFHPVVFQSQALHIVVETLTPHPPLACP